MSSGRDCTTSPSMTREEVSRIADLLRFRHDDPVSARCGPLFDVMDGLRMLTMTMRLRRLLDPAPWRFCCPLRE
jgi:hypothetical protein